MRYHNIFSPILELYFWSIHMAINLILAISFDFKLNSNLKLAINNVNYKPGGRFTKVHGFLLISLLVLGAED